jgi:hypothetical protein
MRLARYLKMQEFDRNAPQEKESSLQVPFNSAMAWIRIHQAARRETDCGQSTAEKEGESIKVWVRYSYTT